MPQTRTEQIAAMPAVRIVCGRCWYYGPNDYELGIYWKKNPNPADGEIIYQKWVVLRWRWRAWIDRNGPTA